MPARWVLFVGTLVVLGLISGPVALVAVPLVLIGRKWGLATLAVTAFVAFLVAGVAAAWDPAVLGAAGAGAFSPLAQIASVIALGCGALCVGPGRKTRGENGRQHHSGCRNTGVIHFDREVRRLASRRSDITTPRGEWG